MIKNLICIMNNRNYGGLISMLYFHPENIVFIVDSEKKNNIEFEEIDKFFKNNYPKIRCEKKSVESISREQLKGVLKEYPREDTLVSLFGDRTKAILMAYSISRELQLRSVYVDTKDETMVFMDEEKEIDISQLDLDIRDFIGISGGVILEENSSIFDDIRFINMSKFIINNRKAWEIFKRVLRNYEITIWDRSRFDRVQFLTKNLSNSEYTCLMMFLKELRENDLGRINNKNKYRLSFRFNTMAAKDFIGKVGTWLEVITYNVINELKFIDDAKAGVVFLWDRNEEDIKNEADVLASYSSYLIYISCKDTSHYDANTLNELEVYSKKIGGKAVKKILVATKKSYKSSTEDRAKEMGINILIFDGDLPKFKKDLREIIL